MRKGRKNLFLIQWWKDALVHKVAQAKEYDEGGEGLLPSLLGFPRGYLDAAGHLCRHSVGFSMLESWFPCLKLDQHT